MPDKKTLEKMRKKLENVAPSHGLPENASKSQLLKFELCKQFVIYLRKHEMSQKDLAKKLAVDPARINEIIKYRIDLFTVDRLLGYLEQLEPKLKVYVA